MFCPKCKAKGMFGKVRTDAKNELRCENCLGVCVQPELEEEDINLLKAHLNYEGIYKLPFGAAVDRAAKSEAKLGMFLYRIYQKWLANSAINPDVVINTTIKFILEFSKENAKKALEKIKETVNDNYVKDVKILFQETMGLLDKIQDMMTTLSKLDKSDKS